MRIMSGARRDSLRAFAAALLASAAAAPLAVAQDRLSELTPVTDAMLAEPPPEDWLMWRRTLDAWAYSPLDQVDRSNVSELKPVWSIDLPDGVQEGTPLVHDGVMFFPGPGDMTLALDAASGARLWEHRRRAADPEADAYSNGTNRNLAIHGRLIYDSSFDGYVYALSAETGDLVWESQVAMEGANHSSGPIAANGKVFSGRACAPGAGPAPCVVLAHDAETGEELWRRSTIALPGEPGDETWNGTPIELRTQVGSWLPPSYDPELNLLYVGTSVSAPAPKFLYGDNDAQYLYNNSTLALDADTGEIVWWFQHVVDHWDLDHTFPRFVLDTVVAPDPDAVRWINPSVTPGETRKVITGVPGKTGLVYTLDRETGAFLWATETFPQNIVADIDPATGASTINPDVLFHAKGDTVRICPTNTGGMNWPAGAYSPLTGLMYFPMLNSCADATVTTDSLDPGAVYGLVYRPVATPPDEPVGTVRAISAETGDQAWLFEERPQTLSLVATGGGLVFGGDALGVFRVFDQETGEALWQAELGAPVSGYPIAYAVDGREYVAVSTGGPLRSALLTPELQEGNSNTLYVFALPEAPP